MDRVLILDANQRSALAATRSLGAKGLHVVAADCAPASLAGASRYCAARALYPSPYADSPAFVDALQKIVDRHRIDMLLPMTDVSTALVLQHRHRFPRALLPLPEPAAYQALTDKAQLMERAAALGIRAPRSVTVDNLASLERARERLVFPAVVKAVCSKARVRDTWVSLGVSYARGYEEARAALERAWAQAPVPMLVQEYVAGHGQGVFCLYDHGAPHSFFAHRRLREKPPSGGVSVLCESTAMDPHMRSTAERLLGDVRWHGVAMVEFKVRADGTPYLIEVNGRFWGSLQLAIDAGVDFPYLLYRLAKRLPAPAVERFRIGLRSRWLLGDLDSLYLTLKGRGAEAGLARKLRALREFLVLFAPGLRYEINRIGDLRPFLVELRAYLRAAAIGN